MFNYFFFDTGGFLLQLITIGILIAFPLMYVETFLGSYAQRTNSQIYKMAPIFFGNYFHIALIHHIFNLEFVGLTVSIWLYTIVVILVSTIEESVVIAQFVKRLTSLDNYNLTCPSVNKSTCYNFQTEPPLNDTTCKYYHISMRCEGKGQIRYVSEYYYW